MQKIKSLLHSEANSNQNSNRKYMKAILERTSEYKNQNNGREFPGSFNSFQKNN